MHIVIEFLFPKRLARLSYFIRALLCNGVSFYLYQDMSAEDLSGLVALFVVLLYMSVFVVLPRIRDIGMETWWIALAFIPYVSAFLSVALLFRRTNPRHNPLLQRSPGVPPPLQPGPPAAPPAL